MYIHQVETCNDNKCNKVKCYKRHPRQCRYQQECRRRNICLYKHESTENQNSELIAEMEILKCKVGEYEAHIHKLEEENNRLKLESEKQSEHIEYRKKRNWI